MISYDVVVYVNGYKLNGSLSVMAENYDEAFKKAIRALNEDTFLPDSISLGITDEDIEIESSNAGELFEKELKMLLISIHQTILILYMMKWHMITALCIIPVKTLSKYSDLRRIHSFSRTNPIRKFG